MKKVFTVLSLLLCLVFVQDLFAQDTDKNTKSFNMKGEFHIGLNDFATLEEGSSRFKITPRFGYSFSNVDMVFIDFTYVHFLDGLVEGDLFESSLNYRRYLMKDFFRPFIQFGIGGGYRETEDDFSQLRSNDTYFKTETGVGVSYRYKRWSFEGGMKMNYNEYGNARVQLKPMVGFSFTF